MGDPTALSELIPTSTGTQTLSFSPKGNLRPEFPGTGISPQRFGGERFRFILFGGSRRQPQGKQTPPCPIRVRYFETVEGHPQTVSMRSLLVRRPRRCLPTSGSKSIKDRSPQKEKRKPGRASHIVSMSQSPQLTFCSRR